MAGYYAFEGASFRWGHKTSALVVEVLMIQSQDWDTTVSIDRVSGLTLGTEAAWKHDFSAGAATMFDVSAASGTTPLLTWDRRHLNHTTTLYLPYGLRVLLRNDEGVAAGTYGASSRMCLHWYEP